METASKMVTCNVYTEAELGSRILQLGYKLALKYEMQLKPFICLGYHVELLMVKKLTLLEAVVERSNNLRVW